MELHGHHGSLHLGRALICLRKERGMGAQPANSLVSTSKHGHRILRGGLDIVDDVKKQTKKEKLNFYSDDYHVRTPFMILVGFLLGCCVRNGSAGDGAVIERGLEQGGYKPAV